MRNGSGSRARLCGGARWRGLIQRNGAGRTTLALAAAIAIGAAAGQVRAQDFTGRTLRIVVPFAAGGILDVVGRGFASEFGAALGASAIVENRSGAGGAIGTASVAKAPPDGLTLLFTGGSHNINGSLYTKLPYDPIRDFTGVALVGEADYVVMVNASVPARTIAEFVGYARSRPGQLNYATSGQGSAAHLSMAYLAALAGVDLVQIPMKGMGDAVAEVVAGRAHVMIATGIMQYAKDPRVRFLAVTGAERSRFLPDLPTVAASGVPTYSFASWLGLLAPAATPRPVVERLNAALVKVLKDPAVEERVARANLEHRPLTPAQFDQLLRDDFEKMARVVKLSGATIN